MKLPTKDSGVEWIGEIPAHWETMKLAWCFREVARTGHADLPVLSISIHDGISDEELEAADRDRKVTHIEDRSKYKRVVPGDLAYNMMRAWQGAFGAVGVAGQVSPAYVVAEPKVPLNTTYIELLLRTPMAIEEMRRFSRGIADFRSRLYWEHFRDVRVCLPPVDEQNRIVTEIASAASRIDALVAKKTRFIALLREKREALIKKSVTKGLDASVPVKDTGVEWLGRVPAHWKLGQLRRFADSRCDGPFGSGLKSDNYTDDGARVIRLQNIGSGTFKASNAAFIGLEYWRSQLGGGHDVVAGDLLMAGLGDENNPLGRACVAPNGIEPALVKADCYRFRLSREVNPQFVALALSATAPAECGQLANGATRDRLNLGLASARLLPVPPHAEQKEIVATLERFTGQIDTLLIKTERSIELLREHRTALINAAVTGKIDLRDAA